MATTAKQSTILRLKLGLKLAIVLVLVLILVHLNAQTITATVSGNWSSTTTWGGSTPPTSSNAVIINSGVTVTVDGADACASITINAAAAANGITISSTNSLTVTGAITTSAPSGAVSATIAVGTGTLSAASISITGGSAASHLAILSVSTGTINCSGNITFGGTAAYAQLTFTGAGILNIGGNLGTGGTFTKSTGTVNFNGSAAQTFGGYSYNILESNNIVGITPAAAPTITTLTIANVTANSVFNDGGYAVTTATTLNLNSGTYNCTTATFPWGTVNAGTGTVNYLLNGAQTVAAKTYYNLSLSGSGAKTFAVTTISKNLSLSGTVTVTTGANLTISGNLSVGDGTTLTIGAYTLTVTGTTTVGLGTSGTLTFSSATNPAKTFTGAVTINSGASWTESAAITPAFSSGITNSGTFTASTGIHTFSTNSQALTGTFSIPSITVTTITLTNNNTLTVVTAFAGTGGLTQAANSTLNIGGTSTITTLTASALGNTVNYSGAAQTVKPVSYYNLTLSGSGAKTMTTVSAINGNFALSGTASATASAALTIGGNISIGTGTTFTSGTFIHNIAGNWSNSGTFTAGSGTVNFNGTSAQTVTGATTYNILKINNTAGVTLNNAVTTTTLTIGDVTANSSFSDGGYQVTSTGTLNLTSGSFILGSGSTATTFPAFATNNITAGTTVNYASGITQTVSATPAYSNLTFSGVGTKTAAAALTVNSNLTINAGTFNGGTNTHIIKGNWTNNGGTFTSSTCTVTFSGTTLQTITSNGSAFNNITISNSSSPYAIQLGDNTTVNGTYSQSTNGLFYIGTYNLIFGQTANISITSPSSSRMIVADGSLGDGQVEKIFAASAGSFTFPIGDNTGLAQYSPVTLNLTTNTVLRTIGVLVTTPNPALPTPTPSNYIMRYWSFSDNSSDLTYTYTLNMFYTAADLYNSGTESSLSGHLWNGTNWTSPAGIVTTSTHNLLVTPAVTGSSNPLNNNLFTAFACTSPIVYNVTGGGAYCSGGKLATAVGLTGSDIGVNYQLQIGGVNTGSPIAGTGSALSFGNLTAAGTYTVIATNAMTSCMSAMSGNAIITINPVPADNAGNDKSICYGAATTIGAGSTAGHTYNWSPSAGLSSNTIANPTANPTVTTIYTLTETIAATGCSSVNSMNLTVNPLPAITISTSWCGNQGQVQLSSNAFTSYLWSTGATTQTIMINLAGQYMLTATNSYGCVNSDTVQVAVEYITNGNFAAGNIGFTSAYKYHSGYYTGSDTSGLWPENRYAVGTNANNYHSDFFGQSYTNPGTGNFMIVNGATAATPINVWSETITLNPYTTYYFSAYAMSLNQSGNYAQLWFAINGVQVGNTLNLGPGTLSTTGPFNWTRFYGTWYSGSATSAVLSIQDLQTAASGNDFGLCNISCSTFAALPVSAAPSGGPVCVGNTLNLKANVTGGAAPYTYSWSGPNSFTSTAQNPNISNVTSAAAGTYTVNVTDVHGCIGSGSGTIVVNSLPTVTAAVSSSPVCNGTGINLTSTGNGYTGMLFYENFNGNNNLWTNINNSTNGSPANAAWSPENSGYSYDGITFNSNDVTQFYMANSAAQGSAGTTSVILQSPLMNTTGFTTLSLNFYHYFNFSTGSTAKVDVSTNGTTWTNVATYTSAQGTSTAFANPTINLNAYIGNSTFYIRFNYSASNGYYWAIDNVTLSGATTNYNYSWSSNPLGYSSALQNPTGVIPNVTTTYTISYTSPYNGCSNSATASVVVNQLPTITTQPSSPSAVCSGTGTPTFTVAASGAGTLSYQWQQYISSWANVTNGGVYSGATTTALTITNPAYTMNGYTYRCIVSGTCSPAATSNGAAMLTINPLPTATISGTRSVCQNATAPNITFTGSGGTAPYTFTYKINSGSNLQVSTTSGNSVTVPVPTSASGSFVYTLLSVTDNNGCSQTQSGSATVTVTSAPAATITPVGSTTFCIGGSVVLNANTGTGLTYQWQNGSGNISGATTSTYTATTAINYTIVVTQNTCSTTSSPTTVTVNSYPTATITPAGSTTFCSGGNVVLNANTGSGISYQWQNGSGNISGATISAYTATTSNNYKVVVTQNTCSTTSSPATVTVNSYPTSTITPVGSTTFCSGGNVVLNASTGSGLTYQWLNGSGIISGASTSSYTATTANNYTVIVTQNSCSQTSATTTVTVNPQPIPPTLNVMSPNTGNISNDFAEQQGVSATFNPGSGGTGCIDDYTVSIDGGAPVAYIPGSIIKSTVTNSIVIQGERAGCTTGSGCSGTGYVTLASWSVHSGSSGIWDGTTSTDWNTGDNWDDGNVPVSTTNVVIPSSATFQPVLSGSGTCNNLTINAGASLSVTGTLSCGGNLLISSSATASGAFTQSDCNNVTIAGTATVQLYILTPGYSYVGSPLTGVLCNNVNGFPISTYNNGVYYNPDNPAPASHFPNLFRMDENHSHNTAYDQNVWYAPKLTDLMTPGTGYTMNFTNSGFSISFTGPGSSMNCGDYQAVVSKEALSTDLAHNNIKINQFGKIDTVNGINYGTGPANGWHLVANPYPSPVDWNALVNGGGVGSNINYGFTIYKSTSQYAGIYGTYYYNGHIKAYSGAYAPSQYIPAMKAFYIEDGYSGTGNDSPVITFKNAYRNVSSAALNGNYYRTEENNNSSPAITLRAFNNDNNGMADKAVIMFGAEGSDFGVGKLMNTDESVPNIYSVNMNKNLSIQGISELRNEQIVPLGFNVNASGKYTINASEISNFPADTHIILVDSKNNNEQDLTTNSDYTFAVNKGDETNRFYLRFVNGQPSDAPSNSIMNFKIYPNPSDGQNINIQLKRK